MEDKNSRRDFLKKTTSIIAGAVAVSAITDKVHAAALAIDRTFLEATKFTLPNLPYAYNALEPHIDALTMEIHHGKHHKAYIDNLNKALENLTSDVLSNDFSLKNIFANINNLPITIRNNAGGHYNHSLFWSLMKPNGGGIPTGALADAIRASFGSIEEFKKLFTETAMKRFGSGWAWLIEVNGKLVIGSTANQDNPLMNIDSVEIKGNPVLALDVWEHAYYLKNQNRRADYIKSWWEVVNWEAAEKLYSKK
jgi:Fe-Mn family superoxide dismutase